MNPAAIFLLFCGALVLDSAVSSKVVKKGRRDLFEGDIQLPKKRNRNGILAAKRWPNNTVYYYYGTNWNQTQIDMIQKAIEEIQNNTCVKFVKRTNETSYINIINGKGCNSPIGYQSGVQNFSLEQSVTDSCWDHGTIVHELLHTVGLWHEQARYDRDNYVTINIDNVDHCQRHNFEIQPNTGSNTYGVPYNYLSLMHYKSTEFSWNNQDITITANDPHYTSLIGYVNEGNATDYDKVKRIYQCGVYHNFTVPPVTAPPAPAAPRANAGTFCFDCDDKCASDAASGECLSDPIDMNKFCPKSCGTCPAIQNNNAIAPAPACVDNDPDPDHCGNVDYCRSTYMTQNCAKTCGLC